VLADMTPCQLANSVEPGRAKALVTELFGAGAPSTIKYLPSQGPRAGRGVSSTMALVR
jgi:hypothetical protein